MADKIFHSTAVTFVDMTDSRILDVYIASNHPTVQLCNVNKTPLEYTPDWSQINLKLEASFYLDSNKITPETIEWYTKIGTTETMVGNEATLYITNNVLENNAIITYGCRATYQNLAAFKEITFTRVDTGRNGSDGSSAPAVQAQYSVDGKTNWTATLNAATHKYIRYSYDGGKTWTTEIKMVGEDGTSVNIKGTATSKTLVSGTSYYTLVYNSTTITGAALGDAYLLDGNLYVCVDSRSGNDYFMDVGHIQGPQGNDGQSSYVFIRYATDANGANMTTSPTSTTTHIGICTVNINAAPTTASSYTWSKFVGDSAKSIILSGTSQIFKVSQDATPTYTPTTIMVTAQVINTTVATWEYSTNGGINWTTITPTGVSLNTSTNTLTITGKDLTSNALVIRASNGVYKDIYTVYKVFDGAPGTPASMAFLTNENISFSADASGQVPLTSFTTNVVAYKGITKVAPTIGTITGLPTGMTVAEPVTTSNEQILTFSIADKSILSESSNNGAITIPIISPVSTNLTLRWSKISSGATGVGIKSTTVSYGSSDSSSTQPTEWQSTIPTVAEGKYLWTRTIIDYTDDNVPDTVTYIYAKQGTKGDEGKGGTSVTVSSIQYQAGSSATTAPTGTWSNVVVAVSEGSYLWTKTTFSDGKIAYGVAKQGAQGPKGNDAYTVMLTNESHIFAGDVSNAIAGTAETQVLAYNGSTQQSVTITSVNGKTAATADTDTGITGLKFKCSALSGTSPKITFTCTTSFVSKSGTIPIVLSVGGIQFTKMFAYSIAFKGATGAQGGVGTPASLVNITPSAHYFKSTTGKDGTFTPDYIYLYPRFQTVTFGKWEYSINGGTTWVAASGANGISIGTYNSIGNTLRLSRTSTLYTDTVTSISFRCVSSTASVYDTVSIAKIYDVVDLQLEGRNLVLNSNQSVTSDTYRTFVYDMSEDWVGGNTYTISIKGDINEGQAFGVWANGSATRVTTLTYDASRGLYTSTFVASTSIVTQTPKTLHVYNTPSDTATESSIEWIKLEKGSKLTTYTPAPEDYKSVNFQIYAPNGYLLTNDLPSLTLQTFAYDGSIEIASGATFQWSHLIDDVWTNIAGATGTNLTVTKSDVLKAKSYRCIMTYESKTYTSTITVQDKTDTYNSIMCISSNAKGSECYWVLYTLVYSDTSEIDPLLGPISISAPASPVNGDYWYAVDSVNATVQLKKYNGTSWANSTDKQSLTYLWNIVNDGSVKTPIGGASKVQVVSCHDFTATATLVCDVSNELDGVLTQSSLSITDASDPIVSQTEPTSAVDGQIWIKPNTNGAYNMFVWSEAAQTWITSDMDTRNKVHTSKPSSYSKGDIWITESNTVHSKYLEGTLLQASQDSTVYNENDWSPTLKYDKDIAKINSTLYDLSQYVTITSSGLKIGAVNSDKELSPFTSLFTSTELAFYQNSDKLLTLANNQLTAPRIVVEEELEVNKKISLGDLQITIESNGSFSFAVTK